MAAENQPSRSSPFKAWLTHHARTLIASLAFLWRNAVSSLMTMAVIAIALALPAGLYAMLDNLSRASVGWDDSAQISVFLKDTVSDDEAITLADKLASHKNIEQVKFIHKDQALAEFQRISSFNAAIESLGERHQADGDGDGAKRWVQTADARRPTWLLRDSSRRPSKTGDEKPVRVMAVGPCAQHAGTRRIG